MAKKRAAAVAAGVASAVQRPRAGGPQDACHERYVAGENLCYVRPRNGRREKTMAEELACSLRQKPRYISPKFFYDKRGSRIFEEICGLDEYYPTRTENAILSQMGGDLRGLLDGEFRLVELGSGSSLKTCHILDVLYASQSEVEYVPIDISEFLEDSAQELARRYPDLRITGVVDTYENGLRLARGRGDGPAGVRNLIAFFGSSFGNFAPDEGARFLRTVRDSMGDRDLFLMGLDLVKDPGVLLRAYDDARGVTARFNLNVLARINRDLGADFDLDAFSHHPVYNARERRVEMHIRSLRDQRVSIPGADMSLDLACGELLHTENSYKFSVPGIHAMAAGSGFEVVRLWQDPGKAFAVVLFRRRQ